MSTFKHSKTCNRFIRSAFHTKLFHLLLLSLVALLTACGGGGGGGGSTGGGGGGGDTTPSFTITSPATDPAYTNLIAIDLAGTCYDGHNLELSGGGISIAMTTTCASAAFSFTGAAVSSAGTGENILFLKDTTDTSITPLTLKVWVDVVPPSSVTVVSPIASPVIASDANLPIWGSCEENATVKITEVGQTTVLDSATCSGGTYSLSVAQPGAGPDFFFEITQTDRAGNSSLPYSQDWTVSIFPPSIPIITGPSNPHYVGTTPGTVNISFSCTDTLTVSLVDADTGANGGLPWTTTCSGGTGSIAVTSLPTENTYSYTVYQSTGGFDSSSAVFLLVVDGTPPAAPVLTNPSTATYTSQSPLIVNGACEDGALVEIIDTGGSTTLDSATCTGSTFSFSVTGTDAVTYNLEVIQTDRANNASTAATLDWTVNAAAVPAPTLISHGNTILTNTDSITLLGGCVTGYTVFLDDGVNYQTAGDGKPVERFTCVGSSYTHTLNLANRVAVEGAQAYIIYQEDPVPTASPEITVTWTRDVTAPVFTAGDFVMLSADPNPTKEAKFTFATADITDIYECKFTGETVFSPCTSPKSIFDLANGAYTLQVQAKDLAGNYTLIPEIPWDQQSFSAVGLYHLDDTAVAISDTVTFAATSTINTTADWITSFGVGAGSLIDITGATDPGNNGAFTVASATFNTVTVNETTLVGEAGAAVTGSAYNSDLASYGLDSSSYSGGLDSPLTDPGGTTPVLGNFGTARKFDGAASVMETPSNATHGSLGSVMTLEAWVRVDETLASGDKRVIMSNTDRASLAGWELLLEAKGKPASPNITLFFPVTLSDGTLGALRSAKLNTLNLNTYHHIVLVWNKGTATFFVDGVLFGQRVIGIAGQATIAASTEPIRLGAVTNSGTLVGSDFFNGVIDEVRISQVVRYTADFSATPITIPFAAD